MSARRAGAALVVALALALTGGCSAESPALTETVSDELTAGVVEVADAASTGDLESALAALDTLQQQLDTATSGADVTPDRGARIQVSLDAVRADLETLVAAQAAAATPDPETPAVPVETATPVDPAPQPSVATPEVQPTETDEVGPRNDGKGKDKKNDDADEDKGKNDD